MQLKSQNSKENTQLVGDNLPTKLPIKPKPAKKKKANTFHIIMLSTIPMMAIFLVFGILLTGKNVDVSKASELQPQSQSQSQSSSSNQNDISKYLAIPPLPGLGSSQSSAQANSSSAFKRKVSGMVEAVSCQQISGYAINLENPEKALEVRIYKGRPSYNGGQLITAITPNEIREIDGKSGLFGFSLQTPAEFQGDISYLVVEINEQGADSEVWDSQILPPVKLLKC